MLRQYEGELKVVSWVVRGLAAAVLGFLVWFFLYYPARLTFDAALYLELASRILEGQIPYVDYVEINLPAIHYLNIFPVLLSRAIGIHVFDAFWIFILLLIILSMVLTYVISRPLEDQWPLLHDVLALCIALFAIYTAFEDNFGQREHILMLGYIPFFFLRGRRWSGKQLDWRLAVGIGAFAAVGGILKPYFALPVILPELYWLARYRILRPLYAPEIITFAAIFIAYATHFLIVPGMYEAYFLDLLPFIQRGYTALGNIDMYTLYRYWPGNITETLLLIMFLVLPYKRFFRVEDSFVHFLRGLSLVGLAGVVIYVYQAKGFLYHRHPIRMSLLILVVIGAFFLMWKVKLPRASRAGMNLRLGVQAIVLIALLTVIGRTWLTFKVLILAPVTDELVQLLETYTSEGDGVLILSTTHRSIRTLLEEDRRFVGRHMQALPVSFAFADRWEEADEILAEKAVPPEVQSYMNDLESDIDTYEPELILIDAAEWCSGCPYGLGIYTYLDTVGFVDEVVEPGYEYIGVISSFAVYHRM